MKRPLCHGLIHFFLIIFLGQSYAYASGLQQFCRWANRTADQAEAALPFRGKTSDHTYKGCYQDVFWMEEMRAILCDRPDGSIPHRGEFKDLHIPRFYAFVFDGLGDFNARRASNWGPIMNINGDEGNELGKGSFHGGRLFLTGLSKVLLLNITNWRVFYYAGGGFKKGYGYSDAKACAKEMDRYLDVLEKNNLLQKPVKWATFGYSNGGIDAIRFQNDMPREIDRGLDLVFTVDPVSKVLAFPFTRSEKTIGRRHPRTKTFVNIYQDNDVDSFGPIDIRGRPVSGADMNFNALDFSDADGVLDTNYSHVSITDEKGTERFLDIFLEKFEE